MTVNVVLLLLVGFTIKHFIIDFPLQAYPYQYLNKGTYGHPGGLLHSGLHAIGTWLVLIFAVTPITALIYALVDYAVHYHVDWAKMNLNKKFGLKPDNSEWFWIALGVDQLLHSLTYLGIVWAIV
jgi:hypothetical protein